METARPVVISGSTLTTFSVRVGNVDHPVRQWLGAVVTLLHGLVWIGECSDKAQGEVFVKLPVSVAIKFESSICGCSPCPERARLVKTEPVAHHAPSQFLSGRHVN